MIRKLGLDHFWKILNARHMSAAKHVVDKCGGVRQTAALLGVSIHTVYGWVYAERIPATRQVALLEAARAAGVDLAPDDFFHGVATDAA